MKLQYSKLTIQYILGLLILSFLSCTQEDIEESFINVPETFIGIWVFENENQTRSGTLTISENNIIEEFNVQENTSVTNYDQAFNTGNFMVIEIDFINGNGIPRYIIRVIDNDDEDEVIFERNLSFIEELGGIQIDEPEFFGAIFENINE